MVQRRNDLCGSVEHSNAISQIDYKWQGEFLGQGKKEIPNGLEGTRQVVGQEREHRQDGVGEGWRKSGDLVLQVNLRLREQVGKCFGGVVGKKREHLINAANDVGKQQGGFDHGAFTQNDTVEAKADSQCEEGPKERCRAQFNGERQDVNSVQKVQGSCNGEARTDQGYKEPAVRLVQREPLQRLRHRLKQKQGAEALGYGEHWGQMYQNITP